MKVTKLEHAALLLEQSGHTLLVDPGSLTTPVTEPGNAVAIVITHEHPDHWTPEQLNRILNKAPGTGIYGPAGVARAAEGFDVTVVAEGTRVEVGPFTLAFYGTTHAVIHESIPAPDNIGMLVNGGFFYPGDALTVPDVHVETLAIPSAAPWLKLGEAMDYLIEVKPDRVFPVHDMVLSAAGKALYNARLQGAAESVGAQFFALDPGQSIDV